MIDGVNPLIFKKDDEKNSVRFEVQEEKLNESF